MTLLGGRVAVDAHETSLVERDEGWGARGKTRARDEEKGKDEGKSRRRGCVREE